MQSERIEFFYTWDHTKLPKNEALYSRGEATTENLDDEKQKHIDAMVERIVKDSVLPYLRYEELVRTPDAAE